MTAETRKKLPDPFGVVIPPAEWPRIVKRIIRSFPALNIFDGESDMGTYLLDMPEQESNRFYLIFDELEPNRAEELVVEDRMILVRGQFFEGGMQHRISFHAKVETPTTFSNHPALRVYVLPPVRRVTNLILAYPYEDRQVLLEIPIEGAEPEIRVLDLSIDKMPAFTNRKDRLLPKAMKFRGISVQFFDVMDALKSGKLRSFEFSNSE